MSDELYLIVSAREPSDDRRAFRTVLETFVPRTGFAIVQYPRILDVGCGKCYEASVVNGYFGGRQFGGYSDEVHFIGIDENPHCIREAKLGLTLFFGRRGLYVPRPNYEFIAADARNAGNLPQNIDIAIMRHPDVCQQETWKTILENTRSALSTKNLLIGSVHTDEERETFEELLVKTGYEIILSETNRHALHGLGCFIDQSVICARSVK